MDISVRTVLLDSPDFGSMINVSRVYFFPERNVEIHCTIPKLWKIPKWKIAFQHLPYKMATLFFKWCFQFKISICVLWCIVEVVRLFVMSIYCQDLPPTIHLLVRVALEVSLKSFEEKGWTPTLKLPTPNALPSNCFCYGSERVTLGFAQWWANEKWRNIFLPKKTSKRATRWGWFAPTSTIHVWST